MRKILSILGIILCCLTASASNNVIGGPWNIQFGETMSQVANKIKSANPGIKIQIQNDQKIDIEGPVIIAGETFDHGFLAFGRPNKTNHLCGVIFQKRIHYEYAFSQHLNYCQAEKWLSTNFSKISQILKALKTTLSSKYGTPVKDTDTNIVWRGPNGNFIEITVDKTVNMFELVPEATQHYGCLPCWTIILAYVENLGISDM